MAGFVVGAEAEIVGQDWLIKKSGTSPYLSCRARLFVVVSALLVSLCVSLRAELVKIDIDIESLPTDLALMQFANQTNVQITFSPDVVAGERSPQVRGVYTVSAGLEALLKGTNLIYQFTDQNTVVINRLKTSTSAHDSGQELANSQLNISSDNSAGPYIEELVVTDNKHGKDAGLQDDAVSITVMATEEIERKSVVGMADYLNFFPSVTYLNYGTSWNQVIIRGLSVNFADQATVSTYFGEVPLTLPFSLGISTDLKLVDMKRIEVLRGPHGTIYGSGAMGGTVRHVPVAPKLDKIEGKINLGYGITQGSGDSNNNAVGVLNLPLIEEHLALRVVGYRHSNAGYVDLVSTPEMEAFAVESETTVDLNKDTAGISVTGTRASLLWQKSDEFSLSLLYAKQDLYEDGYIDLNPPLGGYRRSDLYLGFDPFKRDDANIINLVMNYDLGWGALMASVTDIKGDYKSLSTRSFIEFWAAKSNDSIEKKGTVTEVRLTSQLRDDLQILTGFFHERHKRERVGSSVWLGSQISFIDADLGLDRNFNKSAEKSDFTQLAFFGEIAYAINPFWELTLGGRWFDYDRRDAGSAVRSGYFTNSDLRTVEKDQTWKANISYTPDPATMIYARWAQGFRIGYGQMLPPVEICDVDGNNKLDYTNAELVAKVDSDSINNFEVGTKLEFFNQNLTINAALYYVDWQDVPFSVEATSDICRYRRVRVNSGDPRLTGIESEFLYLPTPDLQLSLSLSYADNQYVAGSDVTAKGDRLPFSSKWVGSVGAQYNFNVAGHKAFIRSDYGYRSAFFQNNVGFVVLDAYGKLDMRAGVQLNDFSIELYGTNLTGEDPLTTVWDSGWGYRLPPRVVGMNVSYEF